MRKIYIAFLMVSASLWSRMDTAKGQLPAPTERVWASSETSTSTILASSVTNSTQATDGNVQTASNLNILADLFGLLGPTETVSFTNPVPMGVPIHVKYGINIAVLTVGQSVQIDALDANNNVIGTISSATLVGALGGANTAEAVFTNLTQPCKSIKITYSSTVGLIQSMQNFGSYYEIPTISNIDPDKPVDVLSGTETTNIANAASLLAGVTNPYNAIDGNESTPATLIAVANVLAQQQLTALFPGMQSAGTYAHVLLGLPGNLLNLGLLTGPLTIQLLNNGTVTDTYNSSNWNLLTLTLLSPGSNAGWIDVPSTQAFNGIKIISNSGVANVLPVLNIYEINRSASSYALPVTYTKPLSALATNGTVTLKWTTGLEVNNKLFDIQRSANGNSGWTSILTQASHFAGGNGTGYTYTVNDPLPLTGANYYRLVQQDLDGQSHIDRQIVSVNISGANKFSFAPNPAVNGAVKLTVSGISAGNYNVQIISTTGQLIYKKSVILAEGASNVSITPEIHTAGIYYYHLTDGSGKTIYNQKVLVR